MRSCQPEPEMKNQYISVLLEYYGTKHELLSRSPMAKSRLRYWQKVVAMFERLKTEATRNKVKYRAGRAEAKHLSPVQIALVRYAWGAYCDAEEDAPQVLRRWEHYLYGDVPETSGNMTEYELFRQKRQFREIVAGIKKHHLWPWP